MKEMYLIDQLLDGGVLLTTISQVEAIAKDKDLPIIAIKEGTKDNVGLIAIEGVGAIARKWKKKCTQMNFDYEL